MTSLGNYRAKALTNNILISIPDLKGGAIDFQIITKNVVFIVFTQFFIRNFRYKNEIVSTYTYYTLRF